MSTDASVGNVPEWTVGDRLRKAREHAGLDQAVLAERVGISRNSVINYERGHTRPRPIVLRAWALATGVPLHWLTTGIVPDGPGHVTGQYHASVVELPCRGRWAA